MQKRLSCLQAIHIQIRLDLEQGWLKNDFKERTISFQTLECFRKSVPLYMEAEKLLLRLVHVQFYRTTDCQRYQDVPAITTLEERSSIDEFLSPKYHEIQNWTFDVSNLFYDSERPTQPGTFMQSPLVVFLGYCPAANVKLLLNTCNGSILNCCQPREGFTLTSTMDFTLARFEKIALGVSSQSRFLEGTERSDLSSKMYILHRPTQLPRAPNPEVPYFDSVDLPSSDNPWMGLKAHAEKNILEAPWKLEIWKRDSSRVLDELDETNASLIPWM